MSSSFKQKIRTAAMGEFAKGHFSSCHWISLVYCGLCSHIAVINFLFDHLIKAAVIHIQYRPQVDTLPVSLS